MAIGEGKMEKKKYENDFIQKYRKVVLTKHTLWEGSSGEEGGPPGLGNSPGPMVYLIRHCIMTCAGNWQGSNLRLQSAVLFSYRL